MDVERIIDDIEQLQEMFREAPDIRPLSASDISAANRSHDEALANSPWFRLWQSYGVCCRTESPVLRLGDRIANPSANGREECCRRKRCYSTAMKLTEDRTAISAVAHPGWMTSLKLIRSAATLFCAD